MLVVGAIGAQRADPEELYRRREDVSSAKQAAAIWAAAPASDYEAAWRLSRVSYWVGTHAPDRERQAALTQGINAGERAVRLNPDRPEGHFWLAVDMGALAEASSVVRGLMYRSRIRSELERAMAIDADWQDGSAETALGQWYAEVPRLLGGSRSTAEQHFRHVLNRFPQSKTALSYLAGMLAADGRSDEARVLWQRVMGAPIDPEWSPEDRDYRRQAAERIRVLTSTRMPGTAR
jgi:hypothetical protein